MPNAESAAPVRYRLPRGCPCSLNPATPAPAEDHSQAPLDSSYCNLLVSATPVASVKHAHKTVNVQRLRGFLPVIQAQLHSCLAAPASGRSRYLYLEARNALGTRRVESRSQMSVVGLYLPTAGADTESRVTGAVTVARFQGTGRRSRQGTGKQSDDVLAPLQAHLASGTCCQQATRSHGIEAIPS